MRLRLALALLVAWPTAPLAAAEWTVADMSGAVEINLDGRTLPASNGATLPAGATVATGQNGHALLCRDGDSVALAPNSRIRFPDPATLVAERGNGSYRLASAMTVATPYLRARTAGAAFGVTVTGSGATVQMKEGAAEVATLDGGAARTLSAGTIGLVSAQERYRLIIDGAARGLVESPNNPARPAGAGGPTLTAAVSGNAVEIASSQP